MRGMGSPIDELNPVDRRPKAGLGDVNDRAALAVVRSRNPELRTHCPVFDQLQILAPRPRLDVVVLPS